LFAVQFELDHVAVEVGWLDGVASWTPDQAFADLWHHQGR